MVDVFYSGSQTNALMILESAYGTPSGTINKPLGGQIQSISFTAKNNLVEVGTAGARATQQVIPMMFDVDGTIEMIFQNGKLLAYGLGGDTYGTGTHTLSLADVLSSFSLQLSADSSADSVWKIFGCVVSSLRLSMSLDSPLTLSVDFIGQTTQYLETAGSYTPVANTVIAPQFIPSGAGAGVLKINSTAVAQVQSLEFTLDNGIERIHTAGSRLVTGVAAKRRTGTLRFTVMGENATLNAMFKRSLNPAASGLPYSPAAGALTSADSIIQFDNSSVTGGAATAGITINLKDIVVNDIQLSVPVDGMVTADISAIWTTLDGTTPMAIIDSTTSSTYIS